MLIKVFEAATNCKFARFRSKLVVCWAGGNAHMPDFGRIIKPQLFNMLLWKMAPFKFGVTFDSCPISVKFTASHLCAFACLALSCVSFCGYQYFSDRWCVCMNHEDFEKLCAIAFRMVAATHKEECDCECGFCDVCHALDYISVSWLMEHLLCPGTRRFPNSSFKLYEWACIANE